MWENQDKEKEQGPRQKKKRREGEKVRTGEIQKAERITEKLKHRSENSKRREDKRN